MSSALHQRPVITGTGLWCAAGPSVELAWQSIVAGESAVTEYEGRLQELWPGRYFTAGRPVGDFGPQLLALHEALGQAGLKSVIAGEASAADSARAVDLHRLGFCFGASKGRLAPLRSLETRLFEGLVADHPLYPWPPGSMGNDLREHLSIKGPATCPVAACASGLVALIQAAQWVEWGLCDAVLAGSADYSLTGSVIASYRRLGVLSNWGGNASGACRPFDQDRSGFVIGEGAGLLVVESAASAARRGARPLAVVSGYEHRTDSTGLVESDPEGRAIAYVVGAAVRNAGLNISDIDVVCCHGTGTLLNDRAEARALRTVFGARLNEVPCFSLKGAIGHTLGASGSVETALCVKMLSEQTVPPHLNAENVDPECPIGPLPTTALRRPIRHVLKLSYGFGGHVAAMVLSSVVE